MKKFLIYLSTFLLLFGVSVVFAKDNDKTLCDFLSKFGYATFEVKYDQRLIDPDETTLQDPDGGIKLELLILSDSIEARERLIKSIREVVFFNKSTGTRYIIKSPEIFLFRYHSSIPSIIDKPGIEYVLYIAHTRSSLGPWEVSVHEKKIYKAYFTLTEEMFEQVAPIPVDPSVIENADGDYLVTCPETNADAYLIRVYDSDGFLFEIPWEEYMDCENGICEGIVPAEYGGFRPRVEARLWYQSWPTIMEPGNPDSCNPDGMISGIGWARTSTWFTFSD